MRGHSIRKLRVWAAIKKITTQQGYVYVYQIEQITQLPDHAVQEILRSCVDKGFLNATTLRVNDDRHKLTLTSKGKEEMLRLGPGITQEEGKL